MSLPEPIDQSAILGGRRFHYREWPNAGAQALVLLHGFTGHARSWDSFAAAMQAGYHVYALDQRGHGQSDKPESGYDFASVTADVRAFIEALGLDRPLLVGHSWGGNVALELAATHPEAVAGLVLCDGGFLEVSSRPGMTWERAEHDLAPPDLTHLTPAQLVEGAKRWELGSLWSDEVEAAFLGNFSVAEDGRVRPNLPRAQHMQVVRALWEQKPSELCAQVRCPVLFVAAEREGEGRTREWLEMKREAIARAQARLADCQVLWLPDTIHDIPLHRPRELAQAIEAFAATLDG